MDYLLESTNEMQKRARAQNDEHCRKHEQHHRNCQLGAQLVSSLLQLGDALPPKVDSNAAQSLPQRRSVLQALADHRSKAAKTIRLGAQLLECFSTARQYAQIVE